MVRRLDFSPEEIRFLLNRAGATFAQVDRAHGLKDGVARKAARHPYRAGEMALASALKMPPQALWPSRYDARTGVRLRPQPGGNYAKAGALHTTTLPAMVVAPSSQSG